MPVPDALDGDHAFKVPVNRRGICELTDAAGEIFGTSSAYMRWANMDQFVHSSGMQEGVVAVRRAAGRDGALFFPTFTHAWPVELAAPFDELLHDIDEAECGQMGSGSGKLR
jgi:hypothetical protein